MYEIRSLSKQINYYDLTYYFKKKFFEHVISV